MVRNLCTWRGGNVVPFENLYKEMDNLVDGLLKSNDGAFAPRINLAESDAEFEITVDLPGISSDDVSVELHEGKLTISGKVESHTDVEGKTFHRVERTTGEFRRVVEVGVPVDEDNITAEYKNGVLTVKLPKSEKLRPKKITIQQSANSN